MVDTTGERGDLLTIGRVPIGSIDRKASGWWAMIMLIITEAFLFIFLLFGYYYFAFATGRGWLPAKLPSFEYSGPNTGIAMASVVTMWLAERGAYRGRRWLLAAGLFATLVLGGFFVWIEWLDWQSVPFVLSSDSYSSLYFTIGGFHLAHLIGGLLIIVPLLLWSLLGFFDQRRLSAISIGALYWYFVVAVWLVVFFTFYVTPRITYG
jgi:heme/copper-type cytochrome/quinol oxidase subunit 3